MFLVAVRGSLLLRGGVSVHPVLSLPWQYQASVSFSVQHIHLTPETAMQ